MSKIYELTEDGKVVEYNQPNKRKGSSTDLTDAEHLDVLADKGSLVVVLQEYSSRAELRFKTEEKSSEGIVKCTFQGKGITDSTYDKTCLKRCLLGLSLSELQISMEWAGNTILVESNKLNCFPIPFTASIGSLKVEKTKWMEKIVDSVNCKVNSRISKANSRLLSDGWQDFVEEALSDVPEKFRGLVSCYVADLDLPKTEELDALRDFNAHFRPMFKAMAEGGGK
jgi:hypothetical protein